MDALNGENTNVTKPVIAEGNMATMMLKTKSKEFIRTIVKLSNSIKIANFSSPHSFEFVDGTVLPAAPEELSQTLKMKSEYKPLRDCGRWKDIQPTFMIDAKVVEEIEWWMDEVTYYDSIDIVLVPRILLDAMRIWFINNSAITVEESPFRTGLLQDRVKKILYIDKFCV